MSTTLLPTMQALFEPAPKQWGLRGDPYLWKEMRDKLTGVAVPADEGQLNLVVRHAFSELTGYTIDCGEEQVLVERYPREGMSGGWVSLEFWRTVTLPLLIARARHHQSHHEAGKP